ncbi:universal stress protein [Rhodococcus sp. TAF43]|uniref:universal stress protein n=1 Tax=unclassified Rhodococcus (in: high G+C Gram-positive bacteria) TaxID=192944 RepID=UPI00158178D6|nr:universal stress protein [Rhodococcus sp. W8901]QKT11661.1 universal stress protein [Rhodococcus sp. W8901]
MDTGTDSDAGEDTTDDAGRGAIVVGVDESEAAFDALHWAAGVARRRRMPLHVAHVLPTPGVYLSEAAVLIQAQFTEQLDEAAHRVLARARQELGAVHPGVEFTTGIYPGPPSAALLDVADEAELLVLGATGAGTIGAALVGSTGQRVANHARCPVVVCRGGRTGRGDARPVVVGVDGSEASTRAVRAAFAFAALFGVPLVAVHAWGPDRPIDRYSAFRLVDWPRVAAEERAVLSESLAGFATDHPEVEVVSHLERRSPGKLLLEHSEQAQLVVVGSRGRSRLTGVVLGSTSQNLLHHASCPIMICRVSPR